MSLADATPTARKLLLSPVSSAGRARCAWWQDNGSWTLVNYSSRLPGELAQVALWPSILPALVDRLKAVASWVEAVCRIFTWVVVKPGFGSPVVGSTSGHCCCIKSISCADPFGDKPEVRRASIRFSLSKKIPARDSRCLSGLNGFQDRLRRRHFAGAGSQGKRKPLHKMRRNE
jgi:hypothetical protein